jgi:hypothetical protein
MGTAPETKKPAAAAPGGKHHPEKKEEAPRPVSTKGGWTPVPDGCFSVGCKTKAHRFNFCSEHFEQFKFGLIKKTGEPVPDYEKKYDHYVAYKARATGGRKVA